MKPFKTIDYRGYFIKIHIDEWPQNPRNDDNLGKMICWHRRYNLGDKHNYSANHELLSDLAKMETLGEYVGDIMAEVKKHCIILNLFLYDHSGITISTNPFSCKWDSGQVGYIYVTREKLKEEQLENKTDTEIEEMLREEVKTYDQYLTGNVYGFQIEDKNGNEIDSCWGFFGSDFEENSLLPECRAIIDHTIKERYKQHFAKLKQWLKKKVPLIYRKPFES